MHKQLRDRWCTALRSGEYKQAEQKLYDHEKDGYCCLGVLGVIEGKNLELIEDGNIHGFPNQEFLDEVGLYRDTAHELAGMNDAGHDFEQIADHIEASVWTEADDIEF